MGSGAGSYSGEEVTRYYEIRTFGASDSVMVLFEYQDGEPRYLTADNDSGEDRNAYIRVTDTFCVYA
jgi:hypothetical protein